MWQCLRWEDANYSGRKIRSFAHHTIQGGLPELGELVCVALRISESEQCFLQTGYWPSLEVSVANYLNFLSGGGNTDKTLPLFCPCLSTTVLFGTRRCVSGKKERQLFFSLQTLRKMTCRLVERNSMHISQVKTTSTASPGGKYWCWQSLDVPCIMT